MCVCVLAVLSRIRSKLAGASQSGAGDQPLSGASSSIVPRTDNKLPLSNGVCVTLVKGSLVQQQVTNQVNDNFVINLMI